MNQGALDAAKRLDMRHNVSIQVIDEITGKVVSEHTGHNAATNMMLTGIGHYLLGEGILNQGELLSDWVPQYISLGTLGLSGQDEDANGLPADSAIATGSTNEERFNNYISQCPGYGSDGSNTTEINNREYIGLGPKYTSGIPIECELITSQYTRSPITYRDVVPEAEAEYPKTIDVVFSAMISTGALSAYRDGLDHMFISEVGLWSGKTFESAELGESCSLLAGYRICPPDDAGDDKSWMIYSEENWLKLKKNIIRVGINQVVQVVWKVQLGGIEQLGGLNKLNNQLKWLIVV